MYVNFETIGCVYILASKMAGTLYVGATGDLIKRISEHRADIGSKFSGMTLISYTK